MTPIRAPTGPGSLRATHDGNLQKGMTRYRGPGCRTRENSAATRRRRSYAGHTAIPQTSGTGFQESSRASRGAHSPTFEEIELTLARAASQHVSSALQDESLIGIKADP